RTLGCNAHPSPQDAFDSNEAPALAKGPPMHRRTTLTAAAVLAAGALLLSACTGGGDPAPTSTELTPDPSASVAIRLVLEPGNLDIRETAGAALDQILIDNIYQGLVSRTPEQEIVPALASA